MGEMMKVLAEVLAVCVLGGLAFTSTSHAATAKITDPRKCGLATRSERCAHDAALLVARKVLAKKLNSPVRLYQGPVACKPGRTLLRWRCDFPAGYVSVVYKATSTGWHVYTRVVPT